MFKRCPAYRSSPPLLLYFIHQGATLWLCLGAEEAGDGASKLPHVKNTIEVGVLKESNFKCKEKVALEIAVYRCGINRRKSRLSI